jgi:hypothetical protein
LQQELQEMEARNRRAQKKPSEEANQVLQVKIKASFVQDLKFWWYLMSLMSRSGSY